MICNPVIAGGSKPEWVNGRAEVTMSGKFGEGIFTIPRKSTAICRAIAQSDSNPALIVIRADNIEQYSKSGSATLDRISFSDTEITLKYRAMYPGSYVEYEYVVF